MGIYLNPGNERFQESINSEIFVDKTGLIDYTNKRVKTEQKYLCISRPRRFGKSMAAHMLCAYYDRSCDSRTMFEGLEIASAPSFEKHLNKYDVIFINMQEFLSESGNINELLNLLSARVIRDLKREYPGYLDSDEKNLIFALMDIYSYTKSGFVFIIDEWDCIFRENRNDKDAQNKYLDFLRNLLKDKVYVSLAYMTGIFPIKKQGTHSSLDMFDEVTMTNALCTDRFMGFTESEVKVLCNKYGMDFYETQCWYNGYILEEAGHIFAPESIIEAMLSKKFKSYRTHTATYEVLKGYLDLAFDGLKKEIVSMLAGGRYKVNTLRFSNDMTTFANKDDVFTLLIHLGYLGYDSVSKECFIPNEEIRQEYVNAMTDKNERTKTTADLSLIIPEI